jgi:DNA-binding transcriptional ArsR family regulator
MIIPSDQNLLKVTKVVDFREKYLDDEQICYISVKNRHKFRKPFFLVFQEDIKRCVANNKLKDFDLRLLCFLLGSSHYENHLENLPQTELAKQLNKSQSSISKSLARLEKEGILDSKISGNSKVYCISELIGWRGKAKNYPEYSQKNRVIKR